MKRLYFFITCITLMLYGSFCVYGSEKEKGSLENPLYFGEKFVFGDYEIQAVQAETGVQAELVAYLYDSSTAPPLDYIQPEENEETFLFVIRTMPGIEVEMPIKLQYTLFHQDGSPLSAVVIDMKYTLNDYLMGAGIKEQKENIIVEISDGKNTLYISPFSSGVKGSLQNPYELNETALITKDGFKAEITFPLVLDKEFSIAMTKNLHRTNTHTDALSYYMAFMTKNVIESPSEETYIYIAPVFVTDTGEIYEEGNAYFPYTFPGGVNNVIHIKDNDLKIEKGEITIYAAIEDDIQGFIYFKLF